MPERFHQRLAVVRGIKLQRDAAFFLPALEFDAAAQRVAERLFRLTDVIHDRWLLLFLFRLLRLAEQGSDERFRLPDAQTAGFDLCGGLFAQRFGFERQKRPRVAG